jgi:molybdopterin/thiamine biosynthesis adenylyltransferase
MANKFVALPERPRVKPIYDVLYLNGRVRLGSGPGYASEIEDPDGCYAQLVRLLDGTHSVPELQQNLTNMLDPDAVMEGLTALYQEGFLEDGAERPPATLSERDLLRYAPNLNFFRIISPPGVSAYAPQAVLKEMRVTLLGLGGIGSNVCMALAELGVGHTTAVDFDRVELSNLNRQVLYSTSTIGQSKATVAEARMKEFNPDIEFTSHDQRLGSLADVEEILDDSRPDFVFCLADKPNGFIDFWTNEACVRRGIPFAAASISSRVGACYSVLPGEGPCYQCRVDAEIETSSQIQDVLEYVREHDVNASNGALGPACMFLAYFLSYEMLRSRLEGMGPMLAAHGLLEVDFVTFDQKWHKFERRPSCSICASQLRAPRRVAG